GSTSNPRPIYDAVLVDEAQDLPAQFLRLCYESLDEPRRLVYAYDELQNLSGTGVAPADDIFGRDSSGRPRVTFDDSTATTVGARRDIILEKCYRNSRPVLVTAHSLGFGVYRDRPSPDKPGIVQMFDQPQLWTDIGYEVKSGSLTPGSRVTLTRSAETSPEFLETHSPVDDLVQFEVFDEDTDQALWIADQIKENLETDELSYEDIIVINTNPVTTRKKLGPVRQALHDLGIMTHLAGVDTAADVFFRAGQNSITCTGVYRAKGNEAGMVYIVNAQECHSSYANLATVRNRLFTAITRSKAWVRVVGVGDPMSALQEEYNALRAADFELRFRYPTAAELKQIQIVHRDMSASALKRLQGQKESLSELVSELEAGNIYPEDLDDELLERLKALLRPDS
ncbi:MAG TPA: ATP-binding domain-containing protein, partial [Acidimicrobiales bacterium]|nr:ATP-binding domain-containing protein [Acidimicrobiales bacterium]